MEYIDIYLHAWSIWLLRNNVPSAPFVGTPSCLPFLLLFLSTAQTCLGKVFHSILTRATKSKQSICSWPWEGMWAFVSGRSELQRPPKALWNAAGFSLCVVFVPPLPILQVWTWGVGKERKRQRGIKKPRLHRLGMQSMGAICIVMVIIHPLSVGEVALGVFHRGNLSKLSMGEARNRKRAGTFPTGDRFSIQTGEVKFWSCWHIPVHLNMSLVKSCTIWP